MALVSRLDGPHVVEVGLAIFAAGLVVAAVRPRPRIAVPAEPAVTTSGRFELDRLAWGLLDQQRRVNAPVLDVVARLGAVRLAARGLDGSRAEHAAGIEVLLGPVAWGVLRPDRTRPVTAGALAATLDVLEGLDASAGPGAAGVPRPDRTLHDG